MTVTHAQIQIFLTSEGFAVMGAGVDAVAQLVERGQDAKQVPMCCQPLIFVPVCCQPLIFVPVCCQPLIFVPVCCQPLIACAATHC